MAERVTVQGSDYEREKEMEYFIGYAGVAIIAMMAATELLIKWVNK